MATKIKLTPAQKRLLQDMKGGTLIHLFTEPYILYRSGRFGRVLRDSVVEPLFDMGIIESCEQVHLRYNTFQLTELGKTLLSN